MTRRTAARSMPAWSAPETRKFKRKVDEVARASTAASSWPPR
jgi:hypothetical protein